MRVCVRARMCVRACMCVWRVCACMYVCVSVRAPTQSLQPHGLEPGRLLCPWNAPGKNPGAGRHFLLRGILDPRTEPASLHFLHWQADSPPLAPFSSVQLLSPVPTRYDPMNCSTPGLPVHHQLPEFTQTHAH